MDETLTIFPTSEYAELADTCFAFLISYDGESVEPKVVFDPAAIDADEAEEIALEILEILQRRDIIVPENPVLN